MARGITKNMFLTSTLIAGLFLSGCSSQEEAPPKPNKVTNEAETDQLKNESEVSKETDAQDLIETDSGGSEQPHMDEALAERDQFVEDQQLPLDGSPLSAVTPEQKQFIEEQRTHVEEQGGVWTPEAESLTLALTADACETAILNSHESDASTVQMHIDTSPLFASQLPETLPEDQRAQAEIGMADIMVYGMQHMCPDDFSQWSDAVMEIYPEYYGSQQ